MVPLSATTKQLAASENRSFDFQHVARSYQEKLESVEEELRRVGDQLSRSRGEVTLLHKRLGEEQARVVALNLKLEEESLRGRSGARKDERGEEMIERLKLENRRKERRIRELEALNRNNPVAEELKRVCEQLGAEREQISATRKIYETRFNRLMEEIAVWKERVEERQKVIAQYENLQKKWKTCAAEDEAKMQYLIERIRKYEEVISPPGTKTASMYASMKAVEPEDDPSKFPATTTAGPRYPLAPTRLFTKRPDLPKDLYVGLLSDRVNPSTN